MKERCNNPNNSHYPAYGGKGITVCERWQESFAAFLTDMGHRPRGTTLDRIDNNKPYSPENCRWATPSMQARNRSDNRWIEWRGERRTLTDWAQRLGITGSALAIRIKRWSLPEAMTRPRFSRKRGTTSMPQEEFDAAVTMFAEAGVELERIA